MRIRGSVLKSTSFGAVALVYVLVTGSKAAAQNLTCEGLFSETEFGEHGMKRVLKINSFKRERAIYDYQLAFPELIDWLRDAAAKLLPGRFVHWLDLGAGNAVAQREFLKFFLERDSFPFRATAVGFAKPDDAEFQFEQIQIGAEHDKEMLHYLSGRLFENIPAEEIGMADVITDFYGVISYTNKLDVSLRHALRLLKPGGVFAFLTNEARGGLRIDRENEPLRKYLSRIKGVELVASRKSLDGESIFVLRRLPGVAIEVPGLTAIYYREGKPPAREFESRDDGFNPRKP